jgi:creatinine amidohydrolase/Fe(II)-dependent formamide hydrolase-like protein
MKRSKLPENEYLYLTAAEEPKRRVGFLPIGSMECHGGSLPIGTDLLIARAFAHVFARAVGGIVFPDLAYGYCPNTAKLPGTLSPRSAAFLPYLIEVCRQARRVCERLVLVNIHRGNDAPAALAVDELFQSDGAALYYVDPYTFLGEAASAAVFPGRDNSYKEAALLLAALQVLKDPHADAYAARTDEPSGGSPELKEIRRHGKLGFAYPSAAAHIAARKNVDIQAGLRYYEAAAAKLADLVATWKRVQP